MNGFFKLQRGITSHPMFRANPKWLFAWVWLIEHAAWKDTQIDVKGETVTVKRGELCVSQAALSEGTGLSRQEVRTFLSALEAATMITTKRSGKSTKSRTIVTICNYCKFQDAKTASNHRAAEKQPKDQPTKEEDIRYSAKAESAEAPSMAQIIFGRGVALMVRLGVSDRQARAILGKWRKLHGDGAVFEALKRIHNESPLDPVAFGEGCFRGRKANAPPSLDDHGIPEVDDVEPDFSRGRDTRRPALRHTADNVPRVFAHSAQEAGPLPERDVSEWEGAGELLALRAWGGVQ